MTPRSYATPVAFKEALEQRLRSAGLADLSRRRQLLVFDRLLARVAAAFGDAAVLKGGVALELRLDRARTTKDVDLRLMGSPDDLLPRLQALAQLDLRDFMTFEIEPDPHHPEIQNDGMIYEGLRFRVECRIAGKLYGQRFGLDIAFGDPIVGKPDMVVADDVLAFAGIAPPTVRLYPVETHIAEKLHAYTMPRTRPNSRIKDLPDLALLATAGAIEAASLRTAIETTFAFRKTHDVPALVPDPPAAWATPYAQMALDDQLPWAGLDDLFTRVRAFLDPLLAASASPSWSPVDWRWA
jgi:hypothetical protein